MFLMTIDAKIFNKVLANEIQQYIKRSKHHDHVRFIPAIQGWFKKCKSINTICYINTLKRLYDDAVKAFDKSQHSFMIKTLKNLGIMGINST